MDESVHSGRGSANDAALDWGKVIRRTRKDRKISMTQLAARIDITPQDLGRLERGEFRLSLSLMSKITSALGLKEADFAAIALERGGPR